MSVRGNFLWDIAKVKKVKIKEIREYNVRWNETTRTWEVIVYGFFGGGVVVFFAEEAEKCRGFIDELTEGRGLEKKEETDGKID